MSMSDTQDFARSDTKAWSRQNPASVGAHHAKNGSLQINRKEPSVGRDQLEATAKSFMEELHGLVLTMDALRFDGERSTYQWTLDGTNAGLGGTEVATNKPAPLFRQGRIKGADLSCGAGWKPATRRRCRSRPRSSVRRTR